MDVNMALTSAYRGRVKIISTSRHLTPAQSTVAMCTGLGILYGSGA